MSGITSDRASVLLSALVDTLDVDPTALGERALKVWRVRSPALVLKSKKRGENPVAIATEFMEMLVGSLRSDRELDWHRCEQRLRDYGRSRARQRVPIESLIDELAVYRRTAIEVISTPLQEGPDRDGIVALAQRRLEDVTDHLNQSIARGYFDYAASGKPQKRTRLPAAVSAMVRRSIDIAQSAGTVLGVLRLRARASRLKVKLVHLRDTGHRVARSANVNGAKRLSTKRRKPPAGSAD